jgi:hypothetical protein
MLAKRKCCAGPNEYQIFESELAASNEAAPVPNSDQTNMTSLDQRRVAKYNIYVPEMTPAARPSASASHKDRGGEYSSGPCGELAEAHLALGTTGSLVVSDLVSERRARASLFMVCISERGMLRRARCHAHKRRTPPGERIGGVQENTALMVLLIAQWHADSQPRAVGGEP